VTSIALATMVPTALPNGDIQVGNVTLPPHAARDIAARLWELAGNAPADVQGRIRCRQHLDRLFAHAGRVRCWPTGAKEAGVNVPAVYNGRRCVVRIGDAMTAVLLDRGNYWRGFSMIWNDDALFGPTPTVGVERFSAVGRHVLQLRTEA
jgi:hypothetical protein